MESEIGKKESARFLFCYVMGEGRRGLESISNDEQVKKETI